MRSSTLCRCLLLLLARPTGIIGPAEEPEYATEKLLAHQYKAASGGLLLP